MSWLKLLTPGLRIKRWLLLASLGIAMLSYGAGSLLRRLLFETDVVPPRIIYALTLQSVRQPYRDVFLLSVGLFFIIGGGLAAFRAATAPFPVPSTSKQWIEALAQYQQSQAGPSITVLGQGETLQQVLCSVKLITNDLSGIFVPTQEYDEITLENFAESARPYVQSLTKSKSSINRILSDDIEEEIGNVFLYAAVSALGRTDSGLLISSDLLALDGDVMSALRVGPVHQTQPSNDAIRKLIDCDSLIFAFDDWRVLADTLNQHPPLRRAIQLSRSIKLGILSPRTELDPHTVIPQIAETLQQRNIHFVIVPTATTESPDWQRLIQNEERIANVRTLRLPVVASDSGVVSFAPLSMGTGLLTLFNRYERRHRLHWHI